MFPIYHQPEIQHVIINAVKWAAPANQPTPVYGNTQPVVEVHSKTGAQYPGPARAEGLSAYL